MDLNKPEKLTFRVDHFLGATPRLPSRVFLSKYPIMTLIKDALQLISAGFTIQLDEHGATPLGVLWKDGREQIERFEFLCRIIDDQLDHCTINDLGCGYGAFFSFLKDKPYMKNGRFFGYDICPEMIEKAQNMHGSDDRAFFEILPFPNNMADYSFASGTFNMRATASEESWTEFVKTSICEMYNKSKRGVAFNLLSQNNAQEEWLYYADANSFHQFCLSTLSEKSEIIFNKKETEFTILVTR